MSKKYSGSHKFKSLSKGNMTDMMYDLNEGKIMVTAMPAKVSQYMAVAVGKMETFSFAVSNFQPILLLLNKLQHRLTLQSLNHFHD